MDGLPDEAAGLVSFRLDDSAIESIAARLNIWLGLDPHARRLDPDGPPRDGEAPVGVGGGRPQGDRRGEGR